MAGFVDLVSWSTACSFCFFRNWLWGPLFITGSWCLSSGIKGCATGAGRSIALGLSIFVVGLFKKVVLADGIALYVDNVYEAIYLQKDVASLDAWGAALGFQLQIYFDFSGYADMAVGLARMFNINLPINFDSPYRAVNRFDLWRRWHISFGAFMRQYVFFPLARSKRLKIGTMGALMVTTLVSGLWHGVGATFVIWGGLQGLLMAMSHYRGELMDYLGIKWRAKFLSPWLPMMALLS